MGIRKYDRRLKALCLKVIENVGKLDLSGDAAEVRDRAVARFELAARLLADAIDKAVKEGVEASEAETALLIAMGAAEDNHKKIYQGLQGSFYLRQARGEEGEGTHTRDLKTYLEGATPSRFDKLALTDKVALIKNTVGHAERFLDAELFADQITTAQQSADELDAAWKALLKEDAEASQADRELRKASDEATKHFQVGRNWIGGCLYELGLEATLPSVVPAPSSVYNRGGSGGDEPEVEPEVHDDHEEPTPA